jgi:hypothetical protein
MRIAAFTFVVVALVGVLVACSNQNENPASISREYLSGDECSIQIGIWEGNALDKAGGSSTPSIGELHNELLAATMANKTLIQNFDDFETQVTYAVNQTFAKYGYSPVTSVQVHNCICELDSYSVEGFDYFGDAEYVYQTGLNKILAEGALTNLEADWFAGLHQAVLDAGDYSTALNAIIDYGAQNGLPNPDSALGKGFSVYFNSLGFWQGEKGLWEWYKKGATGFVDAAAGILFSNAGPTFWEVYGRPAVISFSASLIMDDFFDGMDGPHG